MGETGCSKSSHVATLRFELSENPIRDLKSRQEIIVRSLKARNRPRTRIRRVAHSSTTLIRALDCRIVPREQYANSEESQAAQTSLHQPGTKTTYTLVR